MELIKDTTERNLGKKSHKCRICGAEGMFDTYLAREMMQNTKEEFEYFECAECGCLQIVQVPENLGKYYGSGYYSFGQKEDPDRKYQVPITHMEKILDVGCGSGAWLVMLADNGFGNLYGCDPFLERDIHYGERVKIRNCTIHEMEGDGTFDVVRMGDSFEHVTDPEEVLVSTYRLLKSGGVLEMHIPTYPNVAFEMFGPHWYQLDAPRHITLHSVKSLQYLAGKSGLEITKLEYDSNNLQIIRSFFYQHGISYHDITLEVINNYISRKDQLKMEIRSIEANESGYGDHMTVYMVKK